jgi:methyl-accepting chemotaxis protein PixJ
MSSNQLSKSPDLFQDVNVLDSANQPAELKSPFWRSISTQLFVTVLAAAFLGLGGMGLYFFKLLEAQGQAQIKTTLDSQVQQLEGQLNQVEQFAVGLGNTAEILHNSNNRSSEDYKALVVSSFRNRPPIVQGFGILQTPNGLARNRTWYAPYIYEPDAQSQRQLKPSEERLININSHIFGDLALTDEYPKQDYYTKPLQQNQSFWDEPYITATYPVALTTFTGVIRNPQGQAIGVFNADISLKNLVERYAKTPAYQQSGHFILLSSGGNVLAYPPDPSKAAKMVNAKDVKALQQLWAQVQAQLAKRSIGILPMEGRNTYVAYQRLENGWVLLAEVPTAAITGPASSSTAAAILIVGGALAAAVALFNRRLNSRLRPILNECNQLANIDPETQAAYAQSDELDRLSASFFNVLSQLSVKEDEIRNEATFNAMNQERLRLASDAEAESQALATEVENLLEFVEAVQAGDLTVDAPVTQRVTGLLADCLNQLVSELARVIATVNRTTAQVTTGASQLESLALASNDQAIQQSQAVDQVQSLMADVNLRCQETAIQAIATDAAMEQSQAAVSEGLEQVNLMQQGITQLQLGTNQIIQRVQTLTEFLSMTTQFTQDQKRVATLTRVLALNASMTATRAAAQEDPEQFACIAKEFEAIAKQVNDLAVQTNQSLQNLQQQTDQIQTAISGVNSDVVSIDSLMQQFSTSVDQSQQVLGSIQSSTQRVVQLGQQVTQSSQEIAAAAQTTLAALQTTADAAEVTTVQSSQMRTEATQMEQLAKKLQGRVNFFRLPDESFDSGDLSVVSMVKSPDASMLLLSEPIDTTGSLDTTGPLDLNALASAAQSSAQDDLF